MESLRFFSEGLGVLIPVSIVVGTILIILWRIAKKDKIKKNFLTEQGFEYCGLVHRRPGNSLHVKDSEVYIAQNFDDLVPIEIIQFNEITRGTKLFELEIRYRIDGEVKSLRLRDSENNLLTYMDRLGYS